MQARAYVIIALIAGAGIALASLPRAFGENTDPLTAIWNAISDLQAKTNAVQQQQASIQQEINDIKARVAYQPTNQVSSDSSNAGTDLYPVISIQQGGTASQQLVHIVVQNAGSEPALGVKLTVFYKLSLFDVNSIAGSPCTDQGRGIIECNIGTIGAAQQASVVIAATAKENDQKATIIADVSSDTPDPDPGNNYQSYDFTTTAGPLAGNSVEQNTNEPQQQGSGDKTVSRQSNETSSSNSTAAAPLSGQGNQTASSPASSSQGTGQGESSQSQQVSQDTNQTSSSTSPPSSTTSSPSAGDNQSQQAANPAGNQTSSSGR
jgi:hypothetical protein